MGGEQRFDLSLPQIIGGALATMTAAVAASYLGVAGTVIGAAVMSVGSTVGGAVYTHYLKRTGSHLPFLSRQEAGDDPPKKVEGNGELATAALATVREAPARTHGGVSAAPYSVAPGGETFAAPYGETFAASSGETRAWRSGGSAGADPDAPTSMMPVVAAYEGTGPRGGAGTREETGDPDGGTGDAGDAAALEDLVVLDVDPATAEIPAAAPGTAELSRITAELPAAVSVAVSTAAAGTAGPPGSTTVLPAAGHPGDAGGPGRARIWMLAATAVITFAVSMGVILGFEKATGQPVASTVKGERSSGTSFNPGPVVRREEAPPARERAPRPSDSASETAPQATPEPTATLEPDRTEQPGSGATPEPTAPVTPSEAPATSPTQVEPSPAPTGNPTGSPAPAETDAPAQEDVQNGEAGQVAPAGE
ncbi:hypothetical protein [Streptosporangium pseudovulgare]|uniref:Uncharacterized protein n=1 Tax=Streptosporangium pseudovulgare TaxID=35765 RepID=A0ABQ2QIZ2_9ACTN|nr:hypothetical protein [Streptosporangium pseudovulgare]GGP84105.1 hypothetical protein GCM10010140_11360 [Streptosporangium pseudovulgare]